MRRASLDEVLRACRASWGIDTCDPVDVATWRPDVPEGGQCGVTALVLHDRFGGELLLAEVIAADGTPRGHHYWNRLASGTELDATGSQFRDGEVVGAPRTVLRPAGPPRRCAEQYELLAARVAAHCGC